MSAHRGDLGLAMVPSIHGFCSDASVDCRIAGAPPPHDVQRLPLICKEDDVAGNCFTSFVLMALLASPAAAAQPAGSTLASCGDKIECALEAQRRPQSRQERRASVVAPDTPVGLILLRVRKQGHACDVPRRAERDDEASKSTGAVWILSCANASYRVTLVPDATARVDAITADARRARGGHKPPLEAHPQE